MTGDNIQRARKITARTFSAGEANLSLESPPPASEGQPFVTATVEAGLAERIDTFTTCGCGDDDWPLMRHDIQRHFESQSAEIERQAEDIARLHHLDIHNTELLEAAIEGQSYWQARAERAEAAVSRYANNYLLDELHDISLCISYEQHEAIVELFALLADAQPTEGEEKPPKPEEMR